MEILKGFFKINFLRRHWKPLLYTSEYIKIQVSKSITYLDRRYLYNRAYIYLHTWGCILRLFSLINSWIIFTIVYSMKHRKSVKNAHLNFP